LSVKHGIKKSQSVLEKTKDALKAYNDFADAENKIADGIDAANAARKKKAKDDEAQGNADALAIAEEWLIAKDALDKFYNDQSYAGKIENLHKEMNDELALVEGNEAAKQLIREEYAQKESDLRMAKAEAYVRQLMQSYWNKKTYDGSGTMGQKGAANTYDPQSMLDSFWFTKRAGEQGSDVEMLQGGQNLGELKDLMYFVNKLYKSLKVPLTRLNPEDSYKDGAEILREELRFAKFIVRLQMQFAEGLKNAFITHLKIRNWWKEYKLHESYFNLEFNVPSNFFAIRKNQEFELKFKLFSDLTQNESISKT
jgi:hypothetical protein